MSNFTFKEGNQKFIFKSSWDKVLQFDKITDYKNISNKVTCTKGVDFLGIFQGKKICFLEIKDFRKELKKSEKLENVDSLCINVAQKIKDTLAVILVGSRNSTNENEFFKKILKNFINSNTKIFCILHLETNNKLNLTTYQNKLKEKLGWLSCKVLVVNKDTFPPDLDISVEDV